MHISIFVYGTWGDLRPHVRLGMELQKKGHEVDVIASRTYEQWIRERGLGFNALSVDVNTFTRDNAGLTDQNILQQMKTARVVMNPMLTTMALETLEYTRNSDVLITVEFGVALLFDILKANNLRTILINPAPLHPTVEYASVLPSAPDWFPFKQWYNRFTSTIVRRGGWSVLAGPRNKVATEHLGVSKPKFRDFQKMLAVTPALTSVSKHLVTRPHDWTDNLQVTGFLIDDDPEWTPPQDLVEFLDAGDPPVYIGFGSMPDSQPEQTTHTILDALQRSGKRGIILKGWAGLGTENLPENVYILEYAPHTWLFPKMAAVIHHGGSGTTASGLRAGKPTVIVHHVGDQSYWGRLVKEHGVGGDPIPRKKLTVENLTQAIQTLTTDKTMRATVQALGKKIQQEDGLKEAVKWVEYYLAKMERE